MTAPGAALGSAVVNVNGGQLTVGGTLEVYNTPGTQVAIGSGTVTAANTVNQTTINVTGGTATLGPVTGTGTLNVGGSVANVTASGLQQSSVNISSNGSLKLTGGGATNAINSLAITGNGVLDMASTQLIINYGSNPDPSSDDPRISGQRLCGRGMERPRHRQLQRCGKQPIQRGICRWRRWHCYRTLSGQIEVKYTLYGDANLDGVVNGTDFGILAANFGQQATAWDKATSTTMAW